MAVRKIWRLLVVFVIGVAAFAVAITRLNQPPFSACQQTPPTDPSYSATLVEDPSVTLTRYHFRISKDGAPVSGARVCMRADMGGAGGMSGMGLAEVAVEVGPGNYEVPVRFVMGGFWRGSVVIEPPTGQVVGVPIQLDVQTI
ncbi:MAG: FixH family protein [Acidimicrobiales bacterium]